MMLMNPRLFNPHNATCTAQAQRIYARYAFAYTVIDILAAVMFIVGSALFFKESTTFVATWLFLIGSIFFGVRPCISLVREWHLLKIGDYKDLAAKVEHSD